MKTNLKMFFNTSGERPSVVIQRLRALGFNVSIGEFDLFYDWGKRVKEKDVLALGDKVTETLKESKVTFIMQTSE